MIVVSIVEPNDLRLIAGFFIGEASFTFNAGSPRISVFQKELAPLLYVQSVLGGSILPVKARERSEAGFHWSISGGQAAGTMMTLYGLMGSSPRRKEQVAAVLARWRVAQHSTRTRTKCKYGHPLNGIRKLMRNGRRVTGKICLVCRSSRQKLRHQARQPWLPISS